jgi:hypothetical protein
LEQNHKTTAWSRRWRIPLGKALTLKMGHKTKCFFLELLSEKDPKSSRRFITLLISFIFILTCFSVLLLLIFLFISTARLQGVNIEALKIISELLKDIIKYEALVLLGGLGFTSLPKFMPLVKNIFGGNSSSQTIIDPTTQAGPKID